MKRLFVLILCLCLPLTFVGCQNKVDKTENIIVYPDEEAEKTLGGYRENVNDNDSDQQVGSTYYVINTSSKKFHISTCGSVKTIKDENRQTATDRQQLIDNGYSPCNSCKP